MFDNVNVQQRNLRRFESRDERSIAEVWHRSGQAEYTYIPTWQSFTLEQARKAVRDVIVPNTDIWVGLLDDRIVAYLAMDGSKIDRLYVDPSEWRRGWGTRFVELAKNLSPGGLELVTHQENHPARSLYEKHGFQAIAFGISPPPESAPDVTYRGDPQAIPIGTGKRPSAPPHARFRKRWFGGTPDRTEPGPGEDEPE